MQIKLTNICFSYKMTYFDPWKKMSVKNGPNTNQLKATVPVLKFLDLDLFYNTSVSVNSVIYKYLLKLVFLICSLLHLQFTMSDLISFFPTIHHPPSNLPHPSPPFPTIHHSPSILPHHPLSILPHHPSSILLHHPPTISPCTQFPHPWFLCHASVRRTSWCLVQFWCTAWYVPQIQQIKLEIRSS